MKGVELAEVRDVIVGVFDLPKFDMFLRDRFDFDRKAEVADGPFREVVHDVLEHFEQQGADPYLIAEVAAARPMRKDVQALYDKYARGLIGEAYGRQIEQKKAEQLGRYGLFPTVVLQTAGLAQLPAAVPATHLGFQKKIRQSLPDVDAWVFATQQLKQMRRVCRVEVDGAPLGTGFLVGPDAVLTNHHVVREAIDSQWPGERVVCRFDYHIGEGGGLADGTAVALRGAFADWHLDSSPGLTDAQENAGDPPPTPDQLDHALLRLADAAGTRPLFADYPDGPKRGWVKVPPAAPATAKGMPLAILHHPQGAPVKLALDTEAVLSVNANRTRVRYTTNTDQGSSGSPCFDAHWGLVALHHFGDPLHQQAEFNQGVPIATIRGRLTRNGVAKHLGGDPPG